MAIIPENWTGVPLGEVLTSIVGGGTPSKSVSSYFDGHIPWMTVKDMNKNVLDDTADHISQEAVENSSTNVIPAGTPIVATRMSLGKIVVARFDSAINQDLKALFHSEHINKDYLVYWYRSNARSVEELGTGTTVKGIRLEVLKALIFPVAPLAEQKIIAEKLDKLLAKVDSIKSRLDAVPDTLKRFRQSVLAAAVSGKLTKEWRTGNSLEFKWSERLLSDVASNIVDCPHSTPKWSESGKYCVRTTAFNPFYLDMTEQGYVNDEVFEYRVKRLKPEPHDILYSREGTVGIACQIPEGIELCLGQRMVLIRAGEGINPKYLTSVLNSDLILTIVRQLTIGSTAPRVNMKDIKSYPIPVPSIDEQTEIVRRVEKLFTYADKVEAEVNAAQQRINQLTQSILAKAFRGEFSATWREQNPALISGENSAEALLAKIKTEREKQKPKKHSTARRRIV